MSIDQLLEADLKWREDELSALKFAVAQSPHGSVSHKSLLRATWAMLYAHYEGFCIFALSVFLDSVVKSGATREQCEYPLMLFSLEEEFRKVRKTTPPTASFHQFCTAAFPALMAATIAFEVDKDGDFVIAGRSNLYPANLILHCSSFCLGDLSVEANRSKLGLLVTRRNAIAHGEQEVVKDMSEYKPFEDAALDVMHRLAIAIVDAINSKTYLKAQYR